MCHRVRLADQQWTAVGRLLCRRQKNASVRHLSISNQSSIDADNRREKSNDFDIIINGGGIVGLTFLLGLQKSPFLKDKKVLLLERQPPPLSSPSSTSNNDHKTFSNRVSSLTESSRQLFKRLGLWDSLDPHAKRIDRMHVWSYDFHKAIRFRNKVDHTLDLRISSSTTTPQSGLQRLPDDDCVCHIVENDRISKALNDQIDQQRIAYSSQVRRIAANQNLVQLQLQDDQTLTTKLLIGCDGFNSLVRTSSSFTQRTFEMDQMGIVGTVQMDPNSINSQNSISYQRFLPQLDSVLALLPLDQTRCSFVLSTTRNRCEQWMAMTDGQFVDQLNELLHTHLTYNDGKSIIKSIVNQMDQLVSSVLPRSMTQAKSFSTAPTVESLHSSSRAAFPLGFATTLPNLAGSVNDNAFINVALIGTIDWNRVKLIY